MDRAAIPRPTIPEMIPYTEFAKLRLDQFCSGGITKTGAPIWEWMGGDWYCDAIGFTWFGRLNRSPDETGCLELNFSEVSSRESENILSAIQLPLSAGMSLEAVREVLGEPNETISFVADRKTYEYRVNSEASYRVSCTIQNEEGLIFLSIAREDVLAETGVQVSLDVRRHPIYCND